MKKLLLLGFVILGILLLFFLNQKTTKPNMNKQHQSVNLEGKEVATLGGGCFWCIEAVFDELRGVESVESGYSGGTVPDPSYQQVCSGNTGHAEVIQIVFDPKMISFKEILEVMYTVHDHTTR